MIQASEQCLANVTQRPEYQHWANVDPMLQNHKRWSYVTMLSLCRMYTYV